MKKGIVSYEPFNKKSLFSLRSLILLNGYEPNLGHYAPSLSSDLFLPLLFLLTIVIAVGFGIFFRSLLTNRQLNQTLPGIFASGLAALAGLVWIIVLLTDKAREGFPGGSVRILFILMTLFAFLAIGHFIYTALGGSDNRIRLFSGATVAVLCAFYMLYAYFDEAFALNSPIKIFDQITFFFVAIFFLAECRFYVGKISDALFLPIGMICMTFTAANAVPGLVYAATANEALVGNVMHDFLSLAFFLYVTAKMLSYPLSVSEQGKQDVFVAEMANTDDSLYEEDDDTHISEEDPRQETFHFDEEEKEDTTSDHETDAEETDDAAQTTLDLTPGNGEQ